MTMHTRRWVVVMLGMIGAVGIITPQFATVEENAEANELTSQYVGIVSLIISAAMGIFDQYQKQRMISEGTYEQYKQPDTTTTTATIDKSGGETK